MSNAKEIKALQTELRFLNYSLQKSKRPKQQRFEAPELRRLQGRKVQIEQRLAQLQTGPPRPPRKYPPTQKFQYRGQKPQAQQMRGAKPAQPGAYWKARQALNPGSKIKRSTRPGGIRNSPRGNTLGWRVAQNSRQGRNLVKPHLQTPKRKWFDPRLLDRFLGDPGRRWVQRQRDKHAPRQRAIRKNVWEGLRGQDLLERHRWKKNRRHGKTLPNASWWRINRDALNRKERQAAYRGERKVLERDFGGKSQRIITGSGGEFQSKPTPKGGRRYRATKAVGKYGSKFFRWADIAAWAQQLGDKLEGSFSGEGKGAATQARLQRAYQEYARRIPGFLTSSIVIDWDREDTRRVFHELSLYSSKTGTYQVNRTAMNVAFKAAQEQLVAPSVKPTGDLLRKKTKEYLEKVHSGGLTTMELIRLKFKRKPISKARNVQSIKKAVDAMAKRRQGYYRAMFYSAGNEIRERAGLGRSGAGRGFSGEISKGKKASKGIRVKGGRGIPAKEFDIGTKVAFIKIDARWAGKAAVQAGKAAMQAEIAGMEKSLKKQIEGFKASPPKKRKQKVKRRSK